MVFNSIEFAAFLPVVFLLYWFVFGGNVRVQNFFVVVASYVFYGWWDWRFLILIAFTSGKNYLTSDYNNFSDPEHFGQFVGWNMLKDIYEHREIMK